MKMSIYKAPKPVQPPYTLFKIVLLRVLFPPILLWDLLRILFNTLLGKWVGGYILDDIPYASGREAYQQYEFSLQVNEAKDDNKRLLIELSRSRPSDKEIENENENENTPTKIKLGTFTEKEFLTEKNLNLLKNQIENLLSQNQEAVIHFSRSNNDHNLTGRLIYQTLSEKNKKRFFYGNDLVFSENKERQAGDGEVVIYQEKTGTENKIYIKDVYIDQFCKRKSENRNRSLYDHENKACTKILAHYPKNTLAELLEDHHPSIYSIFGYDISQCRRSEDYFIRLPEVVTHDGCHLETIEVMPVGEKETSKSKKYLINFHGRNQSATTGVPHSMREIIYSAKKLNSTVINFSYRGLGLSTGKAQSKDDLVTDGIAQVQRLLDQAVLPEDITLYGHSLGGGVATLVAKYFYRHGKSIKVINDRSFSSLTNVACGWIMKGLKHFGFPILGIVLAKGLKPLIKFFIVLMKWEMAVDDAYNVLPEQKKLCFLVKGKKEAETNQETDANIDSEITESRAVVPDNKPKLERDEDGIIPHYASLYSAIKPGAFFRDANKETQNLHKISSMEGFNGGGRTLHRNSLFSLKTREDKVPFDIIEDFVFDYKVVK